MRKRGRPARPAQPSRLLSKLVVGVHADDQNPLPQRERDLLMGCMHSALESIARGQHPGEDDWRHLSDAINVVETLFLRGNLVRDEVHATWAAACYAMARAGERWHASQVMRMDGEGLRAVRECVGHYAQAMEGLPERDFLLAVYETRERLAAIAAGRVVSDREVVIV